MDPHPEEDGRVSAHPGIASDEAAVPPTLHEEEVMRFVFPLGDARRRERRIVNRPLPVLAAIAAFVLLIGPLGLRAEDDASLIIQARVGQILNSAQVTIAGETIASTVVLPAFYERGEYQPAWTDPANVQALFAAISDSATDGLNPADYHLAALQALSTAPPGPMRDADFDMLATDAVVRLAYHLRFGKVDVARIDPNWNFRSDYEAILSLAPAAEIQQALDQKRLQEALVLLRPSHPLYTALRATLDTYRRIEAAGGWKPIPAGKTLRPGESDPRVPALRTRLAAEGYLGADAGDAGDLYDPVLEAAMRQFQQRHGLALDGALGGKTLRALNAPVAARIDQIRLSLERSRLIMQDLPDRFVIVNVPAFRLYYVEQGEVRFATNVVVGKLLARTPIFRAEITYAVINPSWTVPPVVMKSDILPGLERDPEYLERKGLMRVGSQIVQPPGPNNALGRIKLMMPNPHFVYLHDTPAQALFEKDSRSFSSGYVRVQEVFDLAELVIADPQRWPKARLLGIADGGRTRTIALALPLPVLIAYWTAGVDPEGQAFFYEDIYNRDPAELKALNGSFSFHPRAVSTATAVSSAPRPPQ
jgi:murein L,D-transpeptidase YcbB/YkuD